MADTEANIQRAGQHGRYADITLSFGFVFLHYKYTVIIIQYNKKCLLSLFFK